MDDCELDLLLKELEADHSDALKYIDRELEKKATTLVVDDYDILQKIGQGTFGEVFKARHKRSKEQFALKRLKTEQESEGVCCELFFVFSSFLLPHSGKYEF
ncbi:unnamed protein product [Echinostoma caproni]|uniref:Protein kinase domain-containing protein n=1 Tax=Echinostoma caproni TaxID=27848 RepID=A0A183A2G8_9TREM|nr:unnamed protein product [Echinostoma caproni]